MPNLLQRGATWVKTALQTAGGRTITYRRRDLSFAAIGTPQKLDYLVDDEDGIPRAVVFYDWTFGFDDLGFSGDASTFASRPGDQITETLNGMDFVYEVAPPGQKPVMEWADSSGVLVTVHTKLVGRV